MLISLEKLDSNNFATNLHDIKKAEDTVDDLNNVVKEVNYKLQAVLESKEKLKEVLNKNNIHSTINSIYGPLCIVIIITITILTKVCKPCRMQWVSNSSQQEEKHDKVQPDNSRMYTELPAIIKLQPKQRKKQGTK